MNPNTHSAVQPPPANHPIDSGEVQLWLIPLEVAECSLHSLERILSLDERERANRFRFADTKRRFIVRHAALRQILGQILSLRPDQIHLERTSLGKPFLTNINHKGTLHLNLSHSGELAIVALTWAGELGVDVEYMRPIAEMINIAETCFTAAEVATLKGLSLPNQALEFFYRCWCQKEAFLKAKGCGLSGIEETLSNPVGLDPYYFHDFTPADRFAGSLCTTFRPARISEFLFRHATRH